MALAIDASTPVRVTNASATVLTTASFTAPSGALLVACVSADQTTGTQATTDSGGLTWTRRTHNTGLFADIFTAVTTSSTARTVTYTLGGAAPATGVSMKVYVVTGQDPTTPIGAVSNGGTSTTVNLTVNAYTSTVANSLGFGVGLEDTAGGVPTSTDTADGATSAAVESYVSVMKAASTPTPGTTVTLNFHGAGGTASWFWSAIEVVPPAGATSGFSQPIETPRRVRGLYTRRGRVAFKQPNQTPPTWLPPRPTTIRRRLTIPAVLRRRSRVQVPLTQTVVTVTFSQPIETPRRVRGLTSRRRQQPQVPPFIVSFTQPIETPRRARGLTVRRRNPVQVPLTQTVAVSFTQPIETPRRVRGLYTRRRQQPQVPLTQTVVTVTSQPLQTVRPRVPAGLLRRRQQPVTPPTALVVVTVAQPPQTVRPRVPSSVLRRRQQPSTPLTQTVVTVTATQPPRTTRARVPFGLLRRRQQPVTPPTTVTVTATQPPPHTSRPRPTFGFARRRQQPVIPVVTVVVLPAPRTRRTLLGWLRRRPQPRVPLTQPATVIVATVITGPLQTASLTPSRSTVSLVAQRASVSLTTRRMTLSAQQPRATDPLSPRRDTEAIR